MKYLILALTLPLTAHANFEMSLGTQLVREDVAKEVVFNHKAVDVRMNYYFYEGLGVSLSYKTALEEDNYIDTTPKYEGRLKRMFSYGLVYRHEIYEGLSVEVGAGKTDSKTSWKVDGVVPSWTGGSDSDYSYHMTTYYKFKEGWSWYVNYSDFYRKDKVGGRERTTGFGTGVTYSF